LKRLLSLIVLCFVLLTSVPTFASEDVNAQGYSVAFNGADVNGETLSYNDTLYLPFRKVFEKMGAQIFYRSRDGQILALSRDGDVIYHYAGSNKVVFNGVEKVLEKPSVLHNDVTYIPLELLEETLYPDGIVYDNQKMNIQKYLFNSDYNKIIQDVLDCSKNKGFYPERFTRYINYHVKKPDCSMQDVIDTVNMGLDIPFYESFDIIVNPYDLTVLVNKCNKLPEGFEQAGLVEVDRAYRSNDGKQYLLTSIAYENYKKMANAAKAQGLSMYIVSAYRTENYQRNLYNNRLATTGRINADNYTARPGHSEHQTGLAVDIGNTKGIFEYTPEFKWLQAHAHEYGFILRYPKGKEWITGYSYEPWHYRYVGTDVAKVIWEQGITYEEYYVKYVGESEFK